MPRAFFRNIASVPLAGKKPTQVFQIETNEDGSPVEVYWRKRFAEGVIEHHVKSASPASPGAEFDSEAPTKKSPSKKGA